MPDQPTPAPQPMPDPQALQPGLSDKNKRRIFLIGGAVVAFFLIASIVSNTKPPVVNRQTPNAGSLQGNPTPAQIKEMQDNLYREQELLTQGMDAAKRKQADQQLAADNSQNAAALQESQQMRQQYASGSAQGGGADPEAQARAERAQRAYKALFEDNVVRQSAQGVSFNQPAPQTAPTTTETEPKTALVAEKEKEKERKPLDFDPAKQRTYWLPEGTLMEAVLTNRLDGEGVGPVNCMITTDVYLPGTRLVIVPQGARVLGEANKVSSLGQQRLAVMFHRMIIPGLHPYSIPLDKQPPALGQEGAVGLKDKVNNHYLSIFGASLAIGAIGGLAQIGNTTTGYGYDPSSQFRAGVSQSMAQSAERVLDKFLNRLPTITIREGTRVKILLADDLQVPSWESMHTQGGF